MLNGQLPQKKTKKIFTGTRNKEQKTHNLVSNNGQQQQSNGHHRDD